MVWAPSGELRRWRRKNPSGASCQISSAILPRSWEDCDCSLAPDPGAAWRTGTLEPVFNAACSAEATQPLGTVKDSPRLSWASPKELGLPSKGFGVVSVLVSLCNYTIRAGCFQGGEELGVKGWPWDWLCPHLWGAAPQGWTQWTELWAGNRVRQQPPATTSDVPTVKSGAKGDGARDRLEASLQRPIQEISGLCGRAEVCAGGSARDRAGDQHCCGVAGAMLMLMDGAMMIVDGPRGMKWGPGPWAGLRGGTHGVLWMTSLGSRPWLVTRRQGIPSHRSHLRWAADGRHSHAQGASLQRSFTAGPTWALGAGLSCWWLQVLQLLSFGWKHRSKERRLRRQVNIFWKFSDLRSYRPGW